jgi:hypothetical protein
MNQGNKKSTPWFESEAGYEAYANRSAQRRARMRVRTR